MAFSSLISSLNSEILLRNSIRRALRSLKSGGFSGFGGLSVGFGGSSCLKGSSLINLRKTFPLGLSMSSTNLPVNRKFHARSTATSSLLNSSANRDQSVPVHGMRASQTSGFSLKSLKKVFHEQTLQLLLQSSIIDIRHVKTLAQPQAQGLNRWGGANVEFKCCRSWRDNSANPLANLPPLFGLAERFNMGTAKSVSSRVGFHRQNCSVRNTRRAIVRNLECVDWTQPGPFKQ